MRRKSNNLLLCGTCGMPYFGKRHKKFGTWKVLEKKTCSCKKPALFRDKDFYPQKNTASMVFVPVIVSNYSWWEAGNGNR